MEALVADSNGGDVRRAGVRRAGGAAVAKLGQAAALVEGTREKGKAGAAGKKEERKERRKEEKENKMVFFF